jgi:hypothetical protein
MKTLVPVVERPLSLLVPRLAAVAAWLWLAVAIPSLTDAACNFFLWLLLAASGGSLGVAWLALTCAKPSLLRPPAGAWWLAVPAAGALGVGLLVTDLGLRLRVALCEDSLSRLVAAVKPGEQDHEPRWVGLFQVQEVHEYQGGVYLFTSQSWLNRHGVAYLPDGAPVEPRMSVCHLYGPWYSFDWFF